MAKIAFLGTGLLGSAMAEAAALRGESVVVWNRTQTKARELEKFGIAIAETPAAAVREVERVHLVLGEDASVDLVLEKALPGLSSTTTVIDHTTVSPASTLPRRQWCDQHGISLIHAPVFMSPKACRDATGLMVCSGPNDRYEAVRPALEQMTGSVWYLGEQVDLAAAYKLFGNAMFLTMVGGLADIYEMGSSLGLTAPAVHSLFSKLKLVGTVDVRGEKMARGDFSPSFALSMARKDLRLMLEATADPGALAVLPALAKRFDEYVERGLGNEDVGVIAKDAVERAKA